MARVASKALGLCDLVIRYVSVERFIHQIMRSLILCNGSGRIVVNLNAKQFVVMQQLVLR